MAKQVNKELEKLFIDAMARWGLRSQIAMLGEESSELSVACSHMLRHDRMKIPTKKEKTLLEFAGEIADVKFMLEEIEYYYNDTYIGDEKFRDVVIKIRKEKEERLKKLMGEFYGR